MEQFVFSWKRRDVFNDKIVGPLNCIPDKGYRNATEMIEVLSPYIVEDFRASLQQALLKRYSFSSQCIEVEAKVRNDCVELFPTSNSIDKFAMVPDMHGLKSRNSCMFRTAFWETFNN